MAGASPATTMIRLRKAMHSYHSSGTPRVAREPGGLSAMTLTSLLRLQQSLQQVKTGFHLLLHTTCKHTSGQLEETFRLDY